MGVTNTTAQSNSSDFPQLEVSVFENIEMRDQRVNLDEFTSPFLGYPGSTFTANC